MLLQDLGVVGVLGGQERPVTLAGVEVFVRGHVVAADMGGGAEFAELLGVGPGEVGTGGVDLVKLGKQTEAVVTTEPLEIPGALDSGGVTAGVVIAHMHPGLVDIGGPHEGAGVLFQHQHPLAAGAALLGGVEPVQPRAHNDFVPGHTRPPVL